MRAQYLATFFALACVFPMGAHAGPTSLNLIPTADTVGDATINFATEIDGSKQHLTDGATSFIFTEYGVSENAEVGMDVYDVNGESNLYLNAKVRLVDETGRTPAFAVGVYHVGQGSSPAYFAIGCKALGPWRTHFGAQLEDGSTFGLAGLEYKVGPRTSLLADWQTGHGRYHTLGVYWTAAPETGVLLYFGRDNTATQRAEGDFVGLYISRTFSARS